MIRIHNTAVSPDVPADVLGLLATLRTNCAAATVGGFKGTFCGEHLPHLFISGKRNVFLLFEAL